MTVNPFPIQDYALLDDAECEQRIIAAKRKLGKQCIVLGAAAGMKPILKVALRKISPVKNPTLVPHRVAVAAKAAVVPHINPTFDNFPLSGQGLAG